MVYLLAVIPLTREAEIEESCCITETKTAVCVGLCVCMVVCVCVTTDNHAQNGQTPLYTACTKNPSNLGPYMSTFTRSQTFTTSVNACYAAAAATSPEGDTGCEQF